MALSGPVALVRPPVETHFKFSKLVESLALGYLAAALGEDGHEIVYIDSQLYGLSPVETAARIMASGAPLVGFTLTHNHFPQQVVEIFDILARDGFPGLCVVGGHAVSFFPERVLDHVPRVDAVAIGEGERTIRRLAARLAAGEDWRTIPGIVARRDGGHVRTPPERETDLDLVPLPARDLTREVIRRDGIVAMATSRGCYARCAFCSVPRFYGLDQGQAHAVGDWHCRSAEHMAMEVADLEARFGLRELLIVDDEFFGGTGAGFERAREFGRRLERQGSNVGFALSCRAENVRADVLEDLRRGGLAHVFVGIEAGTAQSLKLYAKNHSTDQNREAIAAIKKLGLSFQAGYMLFNTHTTLDELIANVAFLKDVGECKPAVLNSAVDPHFGTPMTRLMERKGAIVDEGLRLRAQLREPAVVTAQRVAWHAAEAFEPVMGMLAGLHSSITWEWRRKVPGRSPQSTRLIESFEALANRRFTEVFEIALLRLQAGTRGDMVLAEAMESLEAVSEELRLGAALLLVKVEEGDGQLRYLRQADLIGQEHFPCAVHA
ncbi:radical SAM protein [uncultured Methylobacterium sp.]|jgi:anaerobic magnesium-protoporphyrin IX monomethyl ester cyclase|uniref:B12-binding domain-containing radical SAM protein n=1 Tax=uncultured Methylobacterium sp. TaxID=157278 RepID=UPI002624FC06|nr:radical SAM protein [uncultured Methylobacterium sp.]